MCQLINLDLPNFNIKSVNNIKAIFNEWPT